MIKALASLGHRIDVLVGSGPDDFGAIPVFEELRKNVRPSVTSIHQNYAPISIQYDLAIMAIPFDGRWTNGVHFNAHSVIDGRRRPDNAVRLGFDMWQKHEVEYMMENARELGFEGETPSGSFLADGGSSTGPVYLGIGYKRDQGGFGLSKHFGNRRFSLLASAIRELRPGTKFISSGPMLDFVECGRDIQGETEGYDYFMTANGPHGLCVSFDVLRSCSSYIGNDTGMMHVAASLGIPTMGLFAYKDLIRKNPPLCERSRALFFDTDGPRVSDLAQQFIDFVWS